MNKNLKIALKNCSSEQGFAIPVAVGMGLIMLLIASTMIVRSQGDQVTASAQKGAAQSLAVTEGGVARSLSTLNQLNNGSLLRRNYDPINPATGKTYLGPNGILNDPNNTETTAVNQWLSLPGVGGCTGSTPSGLTSISSIGSGSYQIKAYRYRDPDGTPNTGDEIGTLLIEGQQGSAKSQVQVSLPIVQSPQVGSFPGLFAINSIDLGNNDILKVSGGSGSAANVICQNCTVPNTATQCSGGQPTPDGLKAAVGMLNNSVVDGNIFITNPQPPPVPTAPAGAISLSAVSGGTTLPRSSDVTGHIVGQPYYYTATSMTIGNNILSVYTANNTTSLTANATSGASSISVASVSGLAVNDKLRVGSDSTTYTISSISGNTLTITPSITTAQLPGAVVVEPTNTTHNPSGDPVYIFLSGNFTFGGSGELRHSGSPELLRVYGNPADPTNTTTDQQFTLSGGASATNIFIYAPDATMSINGGANDPDIQGAVWVKTWNGSSSNNAEIRVPDNMATLLGGSFSGIGMQTNGTNAPNSWQRQPVATP